VGHRLSKIYTRTGDKGSTGLGNGARVDKDSARIEAIGSVDELNSMLGVLLTHDLPAVVQQTLTQVQHQLFDLGSELSVPGATMLMSEDVTRLEQVLDQLNAELAPLKEFILPGGAPAAALCHLARTVCRRAERRSVTLAKQESVNPHSVMYLNRLSDLLFVVARSLNKQAGVPEVLWQSRFSRG
jgi:cob(I)alamin adenosyltransferase